MGVRSSRWSSLFAGTIVLGFFVACSSGGGLRPDAVGDSKGEGFLEAGAATDSGDGGEGGAGDASTEGGPPTVLPPFGGFAAKEIYLDGTLQEGAGGRTAIANIRSANAFVVSSPDVSRRTWIHPTDGFVYLSSDNSVHKLVADPNPTRDATGKFWENFPKDPFVNDPIVTMSTCNTDVHDFFVRPDTGKYLHTCGTATKSLLDDAGQLVATCDLVVTVGYGKGILCSDLVFDDAGQSHPITGITDSQVAWRAKADGSFHVVTAGAAGYSLWNLPLTGVGVKVHDYPALAGFNKINADARGWILVDADANLYRWGSTSAAGSADVIAMFTATAGSIVYDETNVWVKMHGSFMVSGP
jgi:hypothetical protein